MLRSIGLKLCGVLLLLGATVSASQDYPAKPIRIIVPWPPGGSSDTTARLVGQKLAERWTHQVIVENRPGAGTTIGNAAVAKAPADGYTVLFTASPLVISALLYRDLSYDVERDFAPVTLAATAPSVLVVHPSLPVASVQELIALAKQRPGQVNYATGGSGSSDHIAGELFKALAGVELTHVPYKGATPALTDVLAGNVNVMFSITITALPHVRSGKLNALAVTGRERSKLLPNVPTVAQAGLAGYEFETWIGAFVPTGTPREVIAKLNSEMGAVLRLSDVQDRLRGMGAEPVGSTPEQFAKQIRSEFSTLGKLVKTIGMKVD
jgi:tripartite-type tricarboxylate transporter receptor subunit TctC